MRSAEPRDFPRPERPDDVKHHEQQESREWFALLSAQSAEEWSHKVDARSPTRLLYSSGWVFKTSVAFRDSKADDARARLASSCALTSRVGVWPPRKRFFVLRSHGYYYPCSASPRMRMLDELGPWAARVLWVCYVMPFVLFIAVRHRLLLDPALKNYGLEPATMRLRYVDDEVYLIPTLRHVLRWRNRGVLR